MRKTIFLILTLIAVLPSCTQKKTYSIDGAVYAGGNFEGEMVYLVPFFNEENLPSDSAVIQNGRFHFDGEIDEAQVYVLRFRPMMELFLDKLVVIKEPGKIWTVLNRPSTAKGTALNDSLQQWREVHAQINQKLSKLNKQLKHAEAEEYDAIATEIDSIKHDFERYNRGVIERNDNAFGSFVDRFAL